MSMKSIIQSIHLLIGQLESGSIWILIKLTTISEYIIFEPYQTIYEDSNFLLVERYARATFSEDPQYEFSVAAVSYKDNKIITQESLTEKLDYDPSEGQNWNWEDYE